MHDQADIDRLCEWMQWRLLVENPTTGHKVWETPQHGTVLSTSFDPFGSAGDCAVVMAEAEKRHVRWAMAHEGPWEKGPLYRCAIGGRAPVYSEESWMAAFCAAVLQRLREGGLG